MSRPLLTFVIVTQLEILLLFIAVVVLAARVDAASRSGSNVIPAVGADPAASGNLSGLSWALPSSLSAGVQRPSPSVARSHMTPPVARRPVSTRSSMKGLASWYEATGLIGAVHSWKWGNRPYYVRVCASRCIRVLVQDHCAGCTGSRLIDLSDDAFRLLAPLSQGIVRVEVTQW